MLLIPQLTFIPRDLTSSPPSRPHPGNTLAKTNNKGCSQIQQQFLSPCISLWSLKCGARIWPCHLLPLFVLLSAVPFWSLLDLLAVCVFNSCFPQDYVVGPLLFFLTWQFLFVVLFIEWPFPIYVHSPVILKEFQNRTVSANWSSLSKCLTNHWNQPVPNLPSYTSPNASTLHFLKTALFLYSLCADGVNDYKWGKNNLRCIFSDPCLHHSTNHSLR